MTPQKALQVLATAAEPTFQHTNQSGAAVVSAIQVLEKLIQEPAPVIVPED
tara:strand:+ start:443 stop:595 length:153 start_codon:yes stop_codon:yes gene_type:complete